MALQSDINQLGSNTYQDLQQVSSTLPGAEIGGVVGAGEVYDANYVEAGSGHQFPVTVIVMAATEGDLTISADGLAISGGLALYEIDASEGHRILD